MKKTLTLILALVLCLSLCACGGTKPSSDVSFKIGEAITIDGFEIVVDEFEYRELPEVATTSNKPLKGFGTKVTVKNISKENRFFDYTKVKLFYDDGFLFETDNHYTCLTDGVLYLWGEDDANSNLNPLTEQTYFFAFIGVDDILDNPDKTLALLFTETDKNGNEVKYFCSVR